MKIGILTQALHGNYGGILQNYALQRVVEQMGHIPLTIDRHRPQRETTAKRVGKWVMRQLHPTFDASLLSDRQKKRINRNQLDFAARNIKKTKPIHTQAQFDSIVSDSSFDAFIVGSDQCWRPCYSPNISNYFLDFADDRPLRRIAYAASFGVDGWEYTPGQTESAGRAAGLLTAVSVREKSGVTLCREHLGIEAQWVLDPTMLLGAEGFRKFVGTPESPSAYIAKYLLEESDDAAKFFERARTLSGLTDVRDNNRAARFRRFTPLSRYANIAVEQWLTNIANARLLVTDSFHGAVFAIMFNVPFIVRLNGTRGNSRLESLLADFGLEKCLCGSAAEMKLPSIDWFKVNNRLKERRSQSMRFLEKALGQ